MRVSCVASGSKSPAICSSVKRSNRLFSLNARMTQSRYGQTLCGFVAVVADRVGEAHHIEPAHRHPLAVVRILQHAIDQLLVSIRTLSFTNAATSCGVGGKPSRSKYKPANQRAPIRLRRWLQADLRQSLAHQHINAVLPRRHLGLHRRLERPVLLIRGPLRDPRFENLLLPRRERLVRIRRRHYLFRICREIRRTTSLSSGLPGTIGVAPESAGLIASSRMSNRKLRLAGFLIRPVAMKTIVGKDRPHVAIEFDLRRNRRLGGPASPRSSCDNRQGTDEQNR